MIQWAKAHDSKFGDSTSQKERWWPERIGSANCPLAPMTGSQDIPGFLKGSSERTKGA